MTYEQCSPGRRVSHAANGTGIVDRISENGEVEVIFDRKTPNGETFRGKYDRRWFEICGELLSPDNT